MLRHEFPDLIYHQHPIFLVLHHRSLTFGFYHQKLWNQEIDQGHDYNSIIPSDGKIIFNIKLENGSILFDNMGMVYSLLELF